MSGHYLSLGEAPSRVDVDALSGPTLLEFGTDWCGHCRAAQSLVTAALARHPTVRHLKVEDGPGRALGRSYRVKRWPTLVLLAGGREVERLVRPTDDGSLLAKALQLIDAQAQPPSGTG
jgi:thioredoxin 1